MEIVMMLGLIALGIIIGLVGLILVARLLEF